MSDATLQDWIVERGLAGARVPALFDGFCRRLVASGIPLARAHLSVAMLHPLVWASGTIWERGKIAESIDVAYGFDRDKSWQVSPFRHMLENDVQRLHRPLVGAAAVLDFPVLEEFRAAGLTGWFGLFHSFGWAVEAMTIRELGVIFSWTTDAPGGWTDAQLAGIEHPARTLALAVKSSSGGDMTRALLATYVGREPAEQILAGRVQRGSVGRDAAIILYADLRGFTDFADAAAPEEVTRRLNGCFDAMGGPIAGAGGEILKFLGDGLLAVFAPKVEGGMAGAAEAALAAAQAVIAGVDGLNAAELRAGNPPLAIDIALHQGEVTFGNVGTAERLDFTIIGPAVNEATRIESLCKTLGQPLLISGSFLEAAPALRPRLRSMGHHRLRGVREPREIFTAD
jgi:adenylate cyclase